MLVGAYGGGLAGVETSTFCAGSDCCCEAGGGELGRVSVKLSSLYHHSLCSTRNGLVKAQDF